MTLPSNRAEPPSLVALPACCIAECHSASREHSSYARNFQLGGSVKIPTGHVTHRRVTLPHKKSTSIWLNLPKLKLSSDPISAVIIVINASIRESVSGRARTTVRAVAISPCSRRGSESFFPAFPNGHTPLVTPIVVGIGRNCSRRIPHLSRPGFSERRINQIFNCQRTKPIFAQ